MRKNSGKSDLAFLEQSNVAIHNAKQNTVISEKLEEVGYDTAKIDEGQTLLDTAQIKYDSHIKEENNKNIAHKEFSNLEAQLQPLYSTHRKRAKIAFEGQDKTLIQLDLAKPIPTKYLYWAQVVKVFYGESLASETIMNTLATLKTTPEDLTSTQALIAPMEEAYTNYIDTVGVAEEGTKEKNDAFYALDIWMRRFYKVAGIALEDYPQLLESLGKNIKS